jgi:hypothetical protein
MRGVMPCCLVNVLVFSAYFLTLKMEAVCSSEKLENFCQTTRRHIP